MAKTGINIKRANVGSVEAHNKRTKEYLEGLEKAGKEIYFLPEFTPNNKSWVNPRYKGKSCAELFEDMKALYIENFKQQPCLKDKVRINKKTGKKTTVAGWSPIREGCPPIKEDTKIEDFAPVVAWARENGLDVIRIDIHKDEGYIDWEEEEENKKKGKAKVAIMKGTDKVTEVCKDSIKFNRHAHVVFDWVDHTTGKTIKLDEKKMSEIQGILADALGMERGTPKAETGLEHIPAAEYREREAAKHAAKMEEKARKAEQDRDAAQRKVEILNNSIAEKDAEIAAKTRKIADLESDIEKHKEASRKAQEDAQRADNARMASEKKAFAEKKRADAEKARADEAEAARAAIEKERDNTRRKLQVEANELSEVTFIRQNEEAHVEQSRKTSKAMDKELNLFSENFMTIIKTGVKLIEGTSVKTPLFGSRKDSEDRSKFRAEFLKSLKNLCDNPKTFIQALFNLPEEIRQEYRRMDEHAENNRYNDMQRKTEDPARIKTNADLRRMHEKESQLLDEMNLQQLSEQTKGWLLEGKGVKVDKQWYDPIKAKWTDKAEAVVSVKDWHLTFNGSLTLRDFLNLVWAKMMRTAQELKEKITHKPTQSPRMGGGIKP